MLNKLNFWLPAIGTISILIPISLGILAYKKSQLAYRVLTAILLLGFAIDFFGLYCYINNIDITDTKENARYAIYAIIETLFYLWFMIKISDPKKITIRFAKWLCVILPVVWFVEFIVFYKGFGQSNIFDAVSAIGVSFISAFLLIQLAEEGTSMLPNPKFWFLVSIFFYFFCSNFLWSLVKTDIGRQVYFMHAILGIISYALFSIGFWRVYKRNESVE
jgi:hypothetical protein